MLKLPSYQQLSREQDTINNLPLDSSFLVTGPPGTGKTVLAIYRAQMFREAGKQSHFLVYGRALNQYLSQAMKTTGVDASATTFHRWFYDWYWRNFGRTAPQLQKYVYDWKAIYQVINQRSSGFQRYDHLVIDEGQDFPKEFYLVMRLIADNITVFADENQRITEQNSTIDEIKNYLQPKSVHRLAKNYRNTRPVAELAREFYAGLRSGIPELPSRNGPKPRLIMNAPLQKQIDYIARYERTNPDHEIAVFVARTDQQKAVGRMLAGKTRNPVQAYVSADPTLKTMSFDQRGIKLLTYASSKGLEFDAVFVPYLETRLAQPDDIHEKMRFYVLTSRARRDLFLEGSGDVVPPVIRPVNQSLLETQLVR